MSPIEPSPAAERLALPPMGVGTWAWGDRRVWGYDRDYGRTEVEQAFWASLDAGLTFFDTAEVYGLGTSERILGELLRQSGKPARVATKYAPFRPSTASLLRALNGSLQRLGLDRVDLYQIHFPPFFVRIEALMDALAEAVAAGKAGAVGVSNFNAAQMRRAHAALARHGIPLAANQVEYSLLDRTPESDGVLRACRELGVTLIAYSPLAMGWLGGRYSPGDRKLPGRLNRYLRAHGAEALSDILRLVSEIAEARSKAPAQVALNWLLQQDGVIVIPGAKNAAQALQNAGALGWQLTTDELSALDQVTRPSRR
jgi:aryl-alcohol dehydrogenase-like predicted oxidoreductase